MKITDSDLKLNFRLILTLQNFILKCPKDNTIVHIGGDGKHTNESLPMEFWVWEEDENDFTIHVSEHKLAGWSRYPETFLIKKNEFAAWYNSAAVQTIIYVPLTLALGILNVL